MSVNLRCEFGSFCKSRLSIIWFQTVRAGDCATYFQKDCVEANFSSSSPKMLIDHAMLSNGGFDLAPRPSVFNLTCTLDFHKMGVPLIEGELIGVLDSGQSMFCWLSRWETAAHQTGSWHDRN